MALPALVGKGTAFDQTLCDRICKNEACCMSKGNKSLGCLTTIPPPPPIFIKKNGGKFYVLSSLLYIYDEMIIPLRCPDLGMKVYPRDLTFSKPSVFLPVLQKALYDLYAQGAQKEMVKRWMGRLACWP